MAGIIRFKTPRDFYNHNIKHMEENYYVHMHVLNYIEIISKKKAVVHNAFNIFGEAGQIIIGFHVSYNFFIYSFGWTPDMLEILVGEVPFSQFIQPFHFLGQRDLILELFAMNSGQWHVHKERLIYECTKISPQPKVINADVENASIFDIEELAELTVAFEREEFPYREHDIADAYGKVEHGIAEKKLYVLKKNNLLCSILQVIYKGDYNRPIIGSLYTNPKARNKGYASLLVRTVTEGLLKNGYEICGLFSDITNPASNKIFVNVGYAPIYHWINIAID